MKTQNSQAGHDLGRLAGRFNTTREALIAAAEAVPAELRDVAFVGGWDLKDVIAHTIGWDYANLEALPDFASGRLPAFFAHYDPDWAACNAGFVARYRLEDWQALVNSLRASQRAFGEALAELSDADLDNVVLWDKRRVSLRGMLRAVDRDEAAHVGQIQAFIRKHAS
jgi:hypothetical protein